MLFLLATLAASATTPTVVRTPEAPAPARCGPRVAYAKNGAKMRGIHPLNEEPPASEYLTVVRTIGGCQIPAVVRTGIGR